MKGPWASQRDIQSLHIPATLTQESSAGAENSSPDGPREQVEKTSAGPGCSHRGALGAGEATCAVKPPLPAGAALRPLAVPRASPGLQFSHLRNMVTGSKTLLTWLPCKSNETAFDEKGLE